MARNICPRQKRGTKAGNCAQPSAFREGRIQDVILWAVFKLPQEVRAPVISLCTLPQPRQQCSLRFVAVFQAHLEELSCCRVAGGRCGGHTGFLPSPDHSCPPPLPSWPRLRKAQEACVSQPSLRAADSSFGLCPGPVLKRSPFR